MKAAKGSERVNLTERYNGGDEFMRVVMRVATRFETWASDTIAFDELDEVWPYLMEDRFGGACVEVVGFENLAVFGDNHCLRVALRMGLPVRSSAGLRVPIDVIAPNPVQGSPFRAFRIQTMRNLLGDDFTEAFTASDDPFDENYDEPFFGIYGLDANDHVEHIADRRTYAEALSLLQKLAPEICLPVSVTSTSGRSALQ